MTVFEKIEEHLRNAAVAFRSLHHEPTRTSEASAKARGEDIAIGAKAIVMKVDRDYKLLVLSAARRVDSKKVRAYFGAQKSRFATAEELMELTGLVPGSVPPFGKPILDLDLFVDPTLLDQPRIAFNAGSLTDSIIMSPADYHRVAKPEVFDFAAAE